MGKVRRRTLNMAIVFSICLFLLVARLGDLSIIQGSGLRAYAVSERTRTITVPALRGQILDAEGHVLAGNIVVDDVSMAPKFLPHADIPVLARALGISVATLRQRMNAGTPLYAMVARGLTEPQGTRIEGLNLPGVQVTLRGTRTYPNGNLLGPVLGFVGVDGQGLAGLEYEYNRLLTGTPGTSTVQVDAGGNILASLPQQITPPKPGVTLRLTIDRTLTAFAQQVLMGGVAKTHAVSGRIVMLDPNTGSVLAMAQYPSNNPNNPAAGPNAGWDDSIVQDLNPPGSTFKPVTAAGALRDHVITAQSTWVDPGYKVIDGVVLHGWEWPGSFGKIGLMTAFKESSDIAFMDIGLQMGMTRFYQNLKLFGFFQAPPIDLPGAARPEILPQAVAHPIDLADEAFGQTNTMSALQLAMADSAVPNGGLLVRPHVVGAEIQANGTVHPVRTRVIRRVMPTWVANLIEKGMEKVIGPGGTGAAAEVPGYTLAGKTGTAQLDVNGKVGNHYMSSFIGFGPIPNPRVLILVQLNDPKGAYYGGQIAAPLFGQLMGETLRYLGIAPTNALPKTGTVHVPRLIGYTVAQAERTLTADGLMALPVGNGSTVVLEEPAAGAAVATGGSVTLVAGKAAGASGGKGDVPYAIGLTLRKAAILLAQRGLRFVAQGSGVVVSQTPVAGANEPAGAVVRLTLRLPAAPPPPPPARTGAIATGAKGSPRSRGGAKTSTAKKA